MNPADKDKIIKAAIRAPSGDNMQPWSFAWKNKKLYCYLEKGTATAVFDITGLASLLSAGAVLENIDHIASNLGYCANIEMDSSSEDAFAVVSFEKVQGEKQNNLANVIFSRSTNRFPYLKKEPPEDILNQLFKTYKSTSVSWYYTINREKIKKTAKIFMQIDRIRNSNRAMHEDLFSKITFGKKAYLTPEGLAEQSLGINRFEAFGFRFLKSWKIMGPLVKFFKLDFAIAHKIKQVNETAPVFAIITVKKNDEKILMEAGRVMQYLWLKSSDLGLDFQPITVLPYLNGLDNNNLSIHELKIVEQSTEDLKILWNLKPSESLVFAFRLGYATRDTCHTRRREASKFVK